jgi:hypothetical protein
MTGENNNSAPLTDRLTVILTLLRHFIAEQSHRQRANPIVARLFWNRVGFCLKRFCALVANPPKPRRTPNPLPPNPLPPTPGTPNPLAPNAHGQPNKIAQTNTQTPITLPRGRGALLRLLPSYQIRGVASQLRHLLDDAEMIALIKDIPQLSQALRPLCHMLAITLPPHLRRPPRPHPPHPKPRSKSRAKPRSKSRANPPAKRPKSAWAAAPSNQPSPLSSAPPSQHPPNLLYPDSLNFA